MLRSKFKDDGIVLLNKGRGITSFGAINKLKRLINADKTGHAGTLDPMTEGLLIVMVNNATKFSDDLMKKDKEYYVELELGYETDTYDTEGEVTKKYEGEVNISEEQATVTVRSFLGEIEQIPPMYSAIKVDGEKLYNLARKGIEVERKPRKVNIYSIREIRMEKGDTYKISFYAEVSSGTYIRSLVRDIGEKTGFYATMTRLIRTKIDKFSLDGSVSLEEIEEGLGDLIVPEKNKDGSPEGIEGKIRNMLDNMLKDTVLRENYKLIRKALKFKDIESIFNYKNITVSSEKYRNLKNGMTVISGIKKFGNMNSVKENELYSVYVTDSGEGDRQFKGIIKVVRKVHDKVYLKRDKYFL